MSRRDPSRQFNPNKFRLELGKTDWKMTTRRPLAMNAEQLASFIFKTGTATIKIRKNGTITIPVVITDARNSYGRIEFQVSPRSGSGTVWLTKAKVTIG